MNFSLNIKIPFKESFNSVDINVDTCLSPFYVTEREVLSVFLEEYSERFVLGAREVIFYASIKADEILSLKLLNINVEEFKTIRRQLTLCLSILSFGNKFNSDFIKAMSRSKTLGDFTVATTVANDTSFLSNTLKDAKLCVDDLLSLIKEINSGDTIARSFVKGKLNSLNYDTSRLWLHRDLATYSSETHASLKKNFQGRYYKVGGNYATKS